MILLKTYLWGKQDLNLPIAGNKKNVAHFSISVRIGLELACITDYAIEMDRVSRILSGDSGLYTTWHNIGSKHSADDERSVSRI